MVRAVLQKQLVVTVDNRVGSLAEMCAVISASGINLVAVCAHAVDNKGVIMMVAEDHAQAVKLLKEKKYDVREEEIILAGLANKPGALQAVTRKIADAGIDLNLVYASVDKSAKTTPVVLISEDNAGVLQILKV